MNIKITLLLVLALFSVSTSPIIGRALENVGAISISFWRMFLASFILWIFSLVKPQGKIKISKNRNKIDYNRIKSPLKKNKDSLLINTTKLNKRACFLKIKKIIDKKINN